MDVGNAQVAGAPRRRGEGVNSTQRIIRARSASSAIDALRSQQLALADVSSKAKRRCTIVTAPFRRILTQINVACSRKFTIKLDPVDCFGAEALGVARGRIPHFPGAVTTLTCGENERARPYGRCGRLLPRKDDAVDGGNAQIAVIA
jgi:hypothetical protein